MIRFSSGEHGDRCSHQLRWREQRWLCSAGLLVLSALAFIIIPGGLTPVWAQSAPVQTEQTLQQADQSREQDRSSC